MDMFRCMIYEKACVVLLGRPSTVSLPHLSNIHSGLEAVILDT